MGATLLEIFIKGAMVGVFIAAPFGTVGVLCLRRLITRGGMVCLVSGMGAALADALFAILAAFGLALVAGWLAGIQFWIRIASGLLVTAIGLKVFFSRPGGDYETPTSGTLATAFISIFFLTISNPANILGMAAIMGAMGVMSATGGHNPVAEGGMLAVGVFLGSASWWVVLGLLSSLCKLKLGERHIIWVNRIGGVVLITLGVLLLIGVGFRPLAPPG